MIRASSAARTAERLAVMLAPAPVERPETWEFFSHHAVRSRADVIAAELNRRSALWVYRVVQSGVEIHDREVFPCPLTSH